MSRHTFPPGSTIGILGGGQLGRMSALAARAMGYRVVVVDPSPTCPAAAVADAVVAAPLSDVQAVLSLAGQADVVTYEWENISAAAVAALAERVPVRPGPDVLRVCQHRRLEKDTLRAAGVPVAPYRPVGDQASFRAALEAIGLPAVLKTATEGYDGKGQAVIRTPDEADAAFQALAAPGRELVLEGFVPFEREISVIVARSATGEEAAYPAVENRHVRNILDLTIAPAPVPPAVAAAAEELALRVARALNLTGVLAVEMFQLPGGELLVNELAPRPHNSGHHTIDSSATSQFEQHIRAVCGLPLGETRLLSPAAMANLLGDLWIEAGGEPDWAAALRDPAVKLHLYGKAEARPGRKMGHLTALAPTAAAAAERVLAARERARRRAETV